MNSTLNPFDPACRAHDLILESLHVLASITDMNHRSTWTQAGARKYLGLDNGACIGEDVRAALGEMHPLAIAHEAALDGQSYELDMEFQDRSFVMRVAPLHDNGGAIVGCMGSGHDITDTRRVERTIMYQAA